MKIALATCVELPGWEIDDRFFHEALDGLGVSYEHPPWTDASVDWSVYDAVVIRTTWDYCDARDDFVAWAQRVGASTLLLNDADTIRWNTKKTYLRDIEALGFPTVPTLWLEEGSTVDVAAMVGEAGWERGFIKPMVGATARETLRFAVDDDGLGKAQTHLDRLLSHEGMMIQPYYGSVEEFGEVSALYIDGTFSHGVRKIPVPGDYRVQDDWGATDELYDFEADQLASIEAMFSRLGRDLAYARVDMLRAPDGSFQLIELELVEPSLFMRHRPEIGADLARAVVRRVSNP